MNLFVTKFYSNKSSIYDDLQHDSNDEQHILTGIVLTKKQYVGSLFTKQIQLRWIVSIWKVWRSATIFITEKRGVKPRYCMKTNVVIVVTLSSVLCGNMTFITYNVTEINKNKLPNILSTMLWNLLAYLGRTNGQIRNRISKIHTDCPWHNINRAEGVGQSLSNYWQKLKKMSNLGQIHENVITLSLIDNLIS